MKRYGGNGELLENIPEEEISLPEEYFNINKDEGNQETHGENEIFNQTSPPSIGGGLGELLPKILKSMPDFQDLMLIGFMYFLYKESGDIEFLIIAGAYLFL